MSFSDLGRKAIGLSPPPPAAAMRPNARTTARQPQMYEEKPPRTNHRRRSDGDVLLTSSSNNKNTTGKTANDLRRKSTTSQNNKTPKTKSDWKTRNQKSVRPRLDHLKCPVTQKTLLDDDNDDDETFHDASLASISVSTECFEDCSSQSYHDNNDDDDDDDDNDEYSKHSKRRTKHLPKHYRKAKQRNNNNNNKQPPKLSTEIAQFQKMVSDLASMANTVSSSPEAMWKTRILLRSAEASEEDLKQALQREDPHNSSLSLSPVEVAAKKKLARDFQRATNQLTTLRQTMELRQRAEMSLLTAANATTTTSGTTAANQKTAMQLEDDFFESAMRERQDKVASISQSMKKVNEIYSDLAGLVDGQQEQIDQIEDLNESTKEDTRAGLAEIQHGIWKLCASDNTTNLPQQRPILDLSDSNVDPAEQPVFYATKKNNNKTKKIIDPNDILACMMCQGPNDENNYLCSVENTKNGRSFDTYLSETLTKQHNDEDDNSKSSLLQSDWTSRIPASVQESAQDVLWLGHKMIGEIVEQVQDMTTTTTTTTPKDLFSCNSSMVPLQTEYEDTPRGSDTPSSDNPLGQAYFDVEEDEPFGSSSSRHQDRREKDRRKQQGRTSSNSNSYNKPSSRSRSSSRR